MVKLETAQPLLFFEDSPFHIFILVCLFFTEESTLSSLLRVTLCWCSGSIDVQELGQVLRFMGLSVPGAAQTDTSTDQDGSSSSSSSRAGFASKADSTSLRADSSELNALTALMAQYDTDKSGELSFDEFAAFARSALQDPSSKPIFLSKRALKNSVKAITRTKALGS